MTTSRLVLVLGGTRSGKSAVAEQLATASGAPVRYLATAPTGPDGDGARIAAHRARRPSSWPTVELAGRPQPAEALRDADGETILLDGLGAWLAGVLHDAGLLDDDGDAPDPAEAIDGASAIASVQQAVERLADEAVGRSGLTVVVGEEAGMAPVAGDRGTRRWVDLLGTAHQTLATRADRVLLVVAGRAIELPRALADGAAAVPEAVPAPPVPADGSAPRPVEAPVSTPPEPTPEPDPAPAAAAPAESAEREEAPRTEVVPAAAPLAAPQTGLVALRVHGDRMVPAGMLDFAVNVVAGDPPGWARQALQAGLDAAGAYPDDQAAAAALGARHGRPTEGVLPLGGAVEGFWRLALAVRPKRAAVLVPGFTESEAALRSVGAEIVRVRREARDDWALDPAAVPEDCDFVAIGRPENPTGVLDPREAILRLRRPGRTLLVDEAFADFVPDEPDALADRRPGDDGPGDLVVLRSLTKALSVPGARAGYLLGDPELVALVRDAGPPWTCPTPSLELLRAYAERPDACERVAARTAAHRGDLVARLRQLAGVQVWDGQANFVLARVPSGVDAVAGLHARGIAVRPCTTFAGLDERYVRIAVRTPAMHSRLATALAQVLSQAEAP
ncbi:bifunctional adenosylcobinamide kinase/adenosylcobinamide-phosphate guanylyltransferase [Patulibacter defluvii]|uniref:bifunctional adenosylcobinamide kinase/adenosylcobinamide-phosphate guanylyltransferase n=1 Tax=Patulibacter defluvii TaxID=3095358 RepID=UPI002A7592DD|nr:bifunctional adenosylcobinamide kinase/adenosylcobinamide-phosphate guanylyltransferase [Patulibacter sp. DM4]